LKLIELFFTEAYVVVMLKSLVVMANMFYYDSGLVKLGWFYLLASDGVKSEVATLHYNVSMNATLYGVTLP
jgi:hypothetical protein